MQNPSPTRKRIFVYRNYPNVEGKVIFLEKTDSIGKLKKKLYKRLNIPPNRLFLECGAEIINVNELQNNDKIYVSEGEPFYRLTSCNTTSKVSTPVALPPAPITRESKSMRDVLIPNQNDTSIEVYNVSVLGAGGVGKSALTLRFVRGRFIKYWDPTIEDAYRKKVEIDGKSATLEILDTAGQDDFKSLRPQWMSKKDGYIFVYSLDSRASLKELQVFFELHAQVNENSEIMPIIMLVANKKDLVERDARRRQVSSEKGQKIAQLYGAHYIETSALLGDNVNEVFHDFIREARKNRSLGHKKKSCLIS